MMSAFQEMMKGYREHFSFLGMKMPKMEHQPGMPTGMPHAMPAGAPHAMPPGVPHGRPHS
jgi:hypothetical protein